MFRIWILGVLGGAVKGTSLREALRALDRTAQRARGS
jgi:hypothetical protein